MRCYKCNSVLSDADFCTGCGSDVATYKKIIRMSNTYYNMGLEKARVRDLSGAADLLKRSVRMNKHNTQARNLLGLVYYEMGEGVQALSEWVISKNLQPHKNLADKYLRDIQQNPARLDLINNTAKKYNKALGYALEGSDDLAIVQLKRILNMCPSFIRCGQLLGLLYIKNKEYTKAIKVLNKILEVDRNNTLASRYLKEANAAIDKIKAKKEARKPAFLKKKEEEERAALSGNDVIIPKSSYRPGSAVTSSIINIMLGLILGASLVYFLITPARENAVRQEYNDKIKEYSANIANNNIEVERLSKLIEDLEEEKAELNKKVEELNGEIAARPDFVDKTKQYETLLEAVNFYLGGDLIACADKLRTLNHELVTTAAYQNTVALLKTASYPKAADHYYALGFNESSKSNYGASIPYLRLAYEYDSEDILIVYRLASDMTKQNGNRAPAEAVVLFNKVIELGPNTEWARYSREFLQMSGN